MATNINISIPTYAISEISQLPTYDAQVIALSTLRGLISDFEAKIRKAATSDENPTEPFTGPTDVAIGTELTTLLAVKFDKYGKVFDPTVGTIL